MFEKVKKGTRPPNATNPTLQKYKFTNTIPINKKNCKYKTSLYVVLRTLNNKKFI